MEADADFQCLVSRLRSGDDEAARELLARYEDALRRSVRGRLKDRRLRRQMDSEDICQSVLGEFFVRMALGEFDFQTPDQLIALLTTMARNRLINHARRQQAARRDVRRLEPADVGEMQPAAISDTPSQIVAGRELLAAFRARLDDEARELAERRARGDAWTDIARDLGGKPDALRVRLARTIERISKELGLESSGCE